MAEKVGRPTVMTEEVVGKLELLFAKGLSDREACLIANIHPSTLYDYCNINPEFAERKELLKEQVKTQAKLNVAEAIENKDVDLSKWYLERKGKDEFSTKQEIKADVDADVTINIELSDD
jgi:outer membrane cobalamin receptor